MWHIVLTLLHLVPARAVEPKLKLVGCAWFSSQTWEQDVHKCFSGWLHITLHIPSDWVGSWSMTCRRMVDGLTVNLLVWFLGYCSQICDWSLRIPYRGERMNQVLFTENWRRYSDITHHQQRRSRKWKGNILDHREPAESVIWSKRFAVCSDMQ